MTKRKTDTITIDNYTVIGKFDASYTIGKVYCDDCGKDHYQAFVELTLTEEPNDGKQFGLRMAQFDSAEEALEWLRGTDPFSLPEGEHVHVIDLDDDGKVIACHTFDAPEATTH